MSLIVATGLPYCAITRGHVAVDIFSGVLDRPGVRWFTAAVQLLGAALLALLSWEVFAKALSSVRFGDVSNMMQIPKAPFMFAIAIAFGLFAVVVLLESLRTASGTRSAVAPQHPTE
jgi:TRAP-type C4-dicarboxylate transport system permease small subunit